VAIIRNAMSRSVMIIVFVVSSDFDRDTHARIESLGSLLAENKRAFKRVFPAKTQGVLALRAVAHARRPAPKPMSCSCTFQHRYTSVDLISRRQLQPVPSSLRLGN